MPNSDVNTSFPRYWLIVPAAGVGARMGSLLPKQYLPLAGKTLLENTLERLLDLPVLAGLVLVVSPQDEAWQEFAIVHHPRVTVVTGGRERCNSVLKGLESLADEAQPSDWVLVHDAARPCVALADIENLIEVLAGHKVGGILGVPVSDTLKQVSESGDCCYSGDCREIERTVDRSVLWQAQTPQMFRYEVLSQALENALTQKQTITDEASAVEWAGYTPVMVEGRRDNIKVTRPEDLPMAELILQQQMSEQEKVEG